MNNSLKKQINEFYYAYVLSELRNMNQDRYENGLTYNSLLYLDLISSMEHCTISRLADLLHIAKSAVTIKVNELEKRGLVMRLQSETDKRVYYIRLTSQADQIYEEYDVDLLAVIKELEERFGAEDIRKFGEILQVFTKHYREKGGKMK